MWLFPDFQYGFRSSQSTADLLTFVSDRTATTMGILKKNATAILFQILLSQRSDMTALRWQKFSGSVSTMQRYIINNISKYKH